MSVEQSALLSSAMGDYQHSPALDPTMDEATSATSPPNEATASSSVSGHETYPAQVPEFPSIAPLQSLDIMLAQSPSSGSSDSLADLGEAASYTETLMEALKSKDRLWVLKLGEMIESLINERRTRIELNPATSYQRMLVHRCSSYYNVAPETEPTTKSIYVYYRAESRIPARRISELVPMEEITQPAFKIMRRNVQDRSRLRQSSQPGSVMGDDGDLSDAEPSETGSISARSNATSFSKKHPTIEEREAAYNEARMRIFKDLEEKEKQKDKDMSANSSTFSLVSGSGSTSGGRSSMGDLDDSASSAATESEWSGPSRDKRDARRTGSGPPSARSYALNGSGSSRNSRATSPSYTARNNGAASAPYDPGYAPPHGYIQYYYPYPPVSQPGQQYMPAYPYYPPPYGGYPPTLPQSPPQQSDPTSPSGAEGTYPPMMGYPGQYWPISPLQPTPNVPHGPPPPNANPQHPGSPPPFLPSNSSQGPPGPQNVPYAYPAPVPYPPYTMPSYFPPPPPPSFQSGQQPYPPILPSQPYFRDMSPPELRPPGPNGYSVDSANQSRTSSRNSNGQGNGTNRRGAPRTRQSYSYGPGPTTGGAKYGADIGPRLSNRRTSGTSTGSGSGSGGHRTPGDESSSTTSSTASSSSQRTFTSTSSKHPLPPRPDWAIGMRVPNNAHHHNNVHSPARMGGNQHTPRQSQQQPTLQANDFPPLCSGPEKKVAPPTPAGAWTNASSMRSVLTSANAANGATALVHYPSANGTAAGSGVATNGVEEAEPEFERPPARSNAELFNPKTPVKKESPSQQGSNTETPEDKVDRDAGKGGLSEDKWKENGVSGEVTVVMDRLAGLELDDRSQPNTPAEAPAVAPKVVDDGSS